ncbi:hypothetical protein ABM135_07630 [Enterococcus cecorum]|uniref:hypothetical protein n=1 Tax=Enterococcus cecorum TaxID=44008 RepID=UPI0032C442D8
MNKQQFMALLKLGLIQSNPQMTNRLRSKGKNGDDLIKGLLLQNLIFPIFIVILYGGIFMAQNLYQYPGQFNGLFLVLVGISLSQGISLIYNTFFDNNDFDHYKTLPIPLNLVIWSKSFITVFTIIIYLFPCLAAFINYSLHSGTSPVLAIILSIFLWIVLIVFIFLLSLLLLFGLSLIPAFKHRLKQVAKVMMILTSVLVVIAILMNSYTAQNLEAAPVFFIRPLLFALSQPFAISGVSSLLGLVMVVALMVILTRSKIYPLLSQNEVNVVTKATKKAVGQKDNAHSILWRYQWRLIGESTLLFQIFSATILLPLFFGFSFMQIIAELKAGTEYYGIFLLVGVLLASLIVTPNSLPAILVSLERQNFHFLATTPQDIKKYLRLKFQFILIIQGALTLLILFGIALVGKFTLFSAIVFVLGGVLYTIPATANYLLKDYRQPFFEWSDYIQLINRGRSNAKMVLIMFAKWIATIIAVVVAVVLVAFFGAFWPNMLLSLLVVGGILAMYIWQILKWQKI